MKLERYKDKKETRKKVILISLTVITLVSITMMLYKTFAKFTTTTSFPIMSGKVIYKKKGKQFGTDIPVVQGTEDGLYKVEHSISEIDSAWNQAEYRYAGANPNNYVYFNCKDGTTEQSDTNCEKWRIIGLVNVKTSSGIIEQRIKIVRNKSIENLIWNGNGINDWTKSTLMGMLNDTYYNSKDDSVYCYTNGKIPSTQNCKFSTGSIKGLTENAKNMIDKEISWNLGGWINSDVISDVMYEKERGTTIYNNQSIEWNIDTTKDPFTGTAKPELFKGIGLMYPSGYGYAVGGGARSLCLSKNLYGYGSMCGTRSWINLGSKEWLLSQNTSSGTYGFDLDGGGGIYCWTSIGYPRDIRPVVFLKSDVKIGEGEGSESVPYHLV